ncbi:pentapeptide repeat-containing protein [Streptomyces sp. NPDC002088]|uniref:pentapeptide repeat-containing protein n=1 Tax=Streptomyces sp. NPDC002088 TaxID=3154665 RepID=UPI003324982F
MVHAILSDVDLTGANLTYANLTGAYLTRTVRMLLPPGATWSSSTRWPAEVASIVAEQSDEVSPGVHRVRGGPAPDRSGSVRV